jgi:hypothetical protein
MTNPCDSGTRKVPREVKLYIDGEETEMVPFVKNILAGTITAVVSELNGYSETAKVEIVLEKPL